MTSVDDVTRFICLFHDSGRARSAVDALEQLGIPRHEMNVVEDGGEHNRTGQGNLEALGVPDADVAHLEEGLRKGGTLVSLRAPESRTSEIERIFHHFSADKIDETEFRTAEPAAAAVPAIGVAAAALSSRPVEETTGQAVIPVAQEQLQVGTREVERGGVRVFRRTVEEPVSETVDLHNERVVLGYREVNRPATDADLNAGSQEIELIETAEVPVVQKVARVVEEVHVGKVETDRTEVINDTVRHTEVEVEPVQEDLDRSAIRGGSGSKF